MISEHFSQLLQLPCHVLSDDGMVIEVDVPFTYADGDHISVLVEKNDQIIRIFDDGGALLHMLSVGIELNDPADLLAIRETVEAYSVSLSVTGNVEISSDEAGVLVAYAKYIDAMLALAGWETRYIEEKRQVLLAES